MQITTSSPAADRGYITPIFHPSLSKNELLTRIINISHVLKTLDSPSFSEQNLPSAILKQKGKAPVKDSEATYEEILRNLRACLSTLKGNAFHLLRQELLVALQEFFIEPEIQGQVEKILSLTKSLDEERIRLLQIQFTAILNMDLPPTIPMSNEAHYLHEDEISEFEKMMSQNFEMLKMLNDTEAFKKVSLEPVEKLLNKLNELLEVTYKDPNEVSIKSCFSEFLKQWVQVLESNLSLTSANIKALLTNM